MYAGARSHQPVRPSVVVREPSRVPLLIGDVFRRNAEVVPQRVAASFGTAQLTHAELDAAGNRLAHVLQRLGVRYGDRVVSWADTCLEVLPLFVALAKLGAVFAPLNARLGAGRRPKWCGWRDRGCSWPTRFMGRRRLWSRRTPGSRCWPA